MNEEWRLIEGYNDCFYVSNYGRVKSLHKKDNHGIKKPSVSTYGYYFVRLSKKESLKYVHRLVAKAFIPNPKDKPQVNHKDGNKLNNHINNLEWVTASENQLHAYRS